jgi:hypothetical protein
VALEVDDLTEVPDGLRVRIRRSKTDQEGEGSEIAIPRGCRLRPVEAVQAWLTAAAVFKIQEVSRHKSTNVLAAYVRSANLFDQHCSAAFL